MGIPGLVQILQTFYDVFFSGLPESGGGTKFINRSALHVIACHCYHTVTLLELHTLKMK
jgi:hypothetical protein